jgi:mRNA interferase YafQ
MSLKNKPASSKRATLPRAVDFAKTFAKDWQRLDHSGRYDMRQLKEVMSLLINNDAPLGPEWLDHALKGQWNGHRECHIGGDFLLIYRLDDQAPSGIVVFARAGTHSELF